MQLIYSALRNPTAKLPVASRRYGYLAACIKHRDTITAIQQYLPGWMPPFEHDKAHLVDQQLVISNS